MFLSELLSSFKDFFLPRFCLSCNQKIKTEKTFVCENCISKVQKTNDELLEYEFTRKFYQRKLIDDFYAPFVFEQNKELQSIIHALKYDKKFLVGKFLGIILADSIKSAKPEWHFDLIIPVPLNRLKKIERNYNQSDYISKGISEVYGIPFSTRALKRIRYTQSQTKLDIHQRQANISGAFKSGKDFTGRNILIVDDVITSGATTEECAKVIKARGASKVYAASIAIAAL
jgi:ComF family protein